VTRSTKWLILGILSLIFGLFCLGNAVAASMAVTTVTGALLLLAGVFQIVAGFGDEGFGAKLMSFLLGALLAVLGLSFLFNPLESMISLALLVTILLAANGIVRLVLAFRMRGTRFFWMMLLSGALSVLLAGFIIANFATASVTLLGILLGVELVFNGAGLIALALFLRSRRA
jgi:membrane protein HdeD